MMDCNIFKDWRGFVKWRNLRAILITLAVSLSFNCTWRTPREGFRYGGLQFFTALTVVNVFVALPATLLHIALGQISQEDVVRVWRTVPFFKGIGFLRLLITTMGSICTTTYLSITFCYFLVTATNQMIFPGCTNSTSYGENANVTEVIGCFKESFIDYAGARQHCNAFLIIMFMVTTVFTVIFYWFTKIMNYVLYVLGPVIIIMCVIIVSGIGDRKGFDTFNIESDWRKLTESDIWHSALTQALFSSQLSGGYLILSGASYYIYPDPRLTAWFIVGTNIITSLAGLIFWFSISGENKDTSAYAVLIQADLTAYENGYGITYPMLISTMLFLSGAISMIIFLYPAYDYMRRIRKLRWRIFQNIITYSNLWVVCLLIEFGPRGLTIFEYTVLPFMTHFGLACEIFAILCFYGLKPLIRDVEFLTGRKLIYWPFAWWLALVFIIIIDIWWVAEVHLWLESWWELVGLISATIVCITIFVIVATIIVYRKKELSILEKFKSSLKTSRNWGPRNALTYLYWRTYCQEVERRNSKLKSKSGRHERPSFRRSTLSVIPEEDEGTSEKVVNNVTGRSNSDGVLYSGYRKAYISNQLNNEMNVKKRSMSLDMNVVRDVDLNSFKHMAAETCNYATSEDSIVQVERNINVVATIERQE